MSNDPFVRGISSILKSKTRRAKRTVLHLCTIPERIAEEVRTDIAAVRQRDPAAKSDLEVLLCSV